MLAKVIVDYGNPNESVSLRAEVIDHRGEVIRESEFKRIVVFAEPTSLAILEHSPELASVSRCWLRVQRSCGLSPPQCQHWRHVSTFNIHSAVLRLVADVRIREQWERCRARTSPCTDSHNQGDEA